MKEKLKKKENASNNSSEMYGAQDLWVYRW